MSSTRTLRLIQDAYVNNDLSAARDAMTDYFNNHCLHPIRQKIYDSHFASYRTILIGCGRCIHCMESKINEWCTRMYAHAEDFKNVYFVTLTYRSISNLSNGPNVLLLRKLKQAIWHYDSYNSTHHLSYNPCLLVKEHYQNFMKRLRKNTGLKDLTFVLSGEYGTEYGRPHFHMVLFTNGTLTKADIIRAWSVCLWRSNSGFWSYRTSQHTDGAAFDFPIGHVDFNDLVSNGTFNTTAKIKVDGTYMNAANCFSYVCKYVVKRDKPNLSRVRLAYRNLFTREKYVKLFDSEVSYSKALDWLLSHGYSNINSENLYNNQLKHLSYEKIICKPSASLYADELQWSKVLYRSGFKAYCSFFPEAYFDFKHSFRPFCEFSRGCPIGSVYAKRNIQEFTQGVFTKPLLQASGFVVPSYFRFKAKNFLYRFREVHKSLKGNSLAMGCLPHLYGRIQMFLETGDLPFPTSDIASFRPCWSEDVYVPPTLFADAYTNEKITFSSDHANYWRYSRSERKYINTRSVPVADFIRDLAVDLVNECERAKTAVMKSQDSLRVLDSALCIMTDLGDDPALVTSRFEECQRAYLAEQNKLYHSSHRSAE